jgi:hypothetical protein
MWRGRHLEVILLPQNLHSAICWAVKYSSIGKVAGGSPWGAGALLWCLVRAIPTVNEVKGALQPLLCPLWDLLQWVSMERQDLQGNGIYF